MAFGDFPTTTAGVRATNLKLGTAANAAECNPDGEGGKEEGVDGAASRLALQHRMGLGVGNQLFPGQDIWEINPGREKKIP